jgi:hypothetical protein
MFVKFLNWLGMAACVTLIISCFLPWTFHADVNEYFTGFYSHDNHYGKPGKFLVFFAVLILVFMILPKEWAKRANLFLSAFAFAYAISKFIAFGSCYNNYCPQKLFGLYLMLGSTVVMLIASAFPNLKITDKKQPA